MDWDVEEMEKRQGDIKKRRLLKLGFIGAELGPGVHPRAH